MRGSAVEACKAARRTTGHELGNDVVALKVDRMLLNIYADIGIADADCDAVGAVGNRYLPEALDGGAIKGTAHIVGLHVHEGVEPLVEVGGVGRREVAVTAIAWGAPAHRKVKRQASGPAQPAVAHAATLVRTAAQLIGLPVVHQVATWHCRSRVLEIHPRAEAARPGCGVGRRRAGCCWVGCAGWQRRVRRRTGWQRRRGIF